MTNRLIVRSGRKLGEHQLETEAHVFGVPHDVVGAPGVVEEIEVDAFIELGLFAGEIERGLDAERNERGVWRGNDQFMTRIAAGDVVINGVHVAVAAFDDIER